MVFPRQAADGIEVPIVGGGRSQVDLVPPVLNASGVSGGIAGGEAGYNFQAASWVFGIEGDGSWVNAASSIAPCVGGTFSCRDSVQSLATIRGRVGYAAGPMGNVLLYVTGGAAWGNVRRFDDNGAGVTVRETHTKSGYVVGGGIEYGLSKNWTLKGEVLYVDLSNGSDYTANDAVGTFSNIERIKERFGVYRLGVNYKFGGPVVARY
jgi:outer membrane immunogenic protein